ncbi:MAG: hypothetical protein ACI9FD_003884, partial [Gammaproteobacteria bacterium]
ENLDDLLRLEIADLLQQRREKLDGYGHHSESGLSQ